MLKKSLLGLIYGLLTLMSITYNRPLCPCLLSEKCKITKMTLRWMDCRSTVRNNRHFCNYWRIHSNCSISWWNSLYTSIYQQITDLRTTNKSKLYTQIIIFYVFMVYYFFLKYHDFHFFFQILQGKTCHCKWRWGW